MVDNDDPDSQALTNGDIYTVQSARGTNQFLVAGSTGPQVRVNAGMLCDGEANDARHGTRHEDRTIPRWEGAGSAGSSLVSWSNTQTPTGEATRPLEDP